MQYGNLFKLLGRVDSTNNYAMAAVRKGDAVHGMAWFSTDQFAGKGQRGRTWLGAPGEALAVSIVLVPTQAFSANPYLLSAVTALEIRSFTEEKTGVKSYVKWPNDIYCNDRKAGGILIENQYKGNQWKWAITGVGLNINQSSFDPNLPNPVSFLQLSGERFEPELLAREIHIRLMAAYDRPNPDESSILEELNRHLYRRGETVRLKQGNRLFETCIAGVNNQGQLITEDSIERKFSVGEVEWMGS